MKVNWDKTIGGVTMLAVRNLLRNMGAGSPWGGHFIRSRVEIRNKVGADIAELLVKAGYLERYEVTPERRKYLPKRSEPYYVVTDRKAYRLAAQKKLPPIPRARADKIVADLIDRADAINADDDMLMRVKRIVAFGSYIRTVPTVGDIDLAVELESKFAAGPDRVAAHRAKREAERQAGRREWWPEREVKLRLRGREILPSKSRTCSKAC